MQTAQEVTPSPSPSLHTKSRRIMPVCQSMRGTLIAPRAAFIDVQRKFNRRIFVVLKRVVKLKNIIKININCSYEPDNANTGYPRPFGACATESPSSSAV